MFKNSYNPNTIIIVMASSSKNNVYITDET